MSQELSREYLGHHSLGGLMGAALGDAMGAATEQHQIGGIIADHGGLLDKPIPPPIDTFSHSDIAGLVTDDCSQRFALTQTLIDTDGRLDDASWIKPLIHLGDAAVTGAKLGEEIGKHDD